MRLLTNIGSLILLPDWGDRSRSLEEVREIKIVLEKLIQPIERLGRDEDWEIVAMERGAVGVRLLYKFGEIPDLSEKYGGELLRNKTIREWVTNS